MHDVIEKPPLQLLHFVLQNILVCIDLCYITKIIPLVMLEKIPSSPPYLVGLMNLAGKSLPIIDLSLRLGLSHDKPYTIDTPIIICADETHQAGLIVDTILKLDSISEETLQMQKEFNEATSPFLAAVPLDTQLSLLINVKRVLDIHLTGENHNLIVNDHLYQLAKYEKASL